MPPGRCRPGHRAQRELDLLGSFRFNDEIDDVITALADGSLFVDPVITHVFPLERGLEAFETAKNSPISGFRPS
jgi:L-idonate 5-dehydrogenase